jgi:hypothetical protein
MVNIAGFAFPAAGKSLRGIDEEMPAMLYQILDVG